MSKNSEMLAKVAAIRGLVPAKDFTAFISALLDARQELARSEVDLEKVRVARDVAITQMRLKHELYRQVFERILDERRDAIEKHFQVIERGLQMEDRELVLGGLAGLGRIVAASPFADLKGLSEALERDQRIEI